MTKHNPVSTLACSYTRVALCIALATTGVLVGCDLHDDDHPSSEENGIKLPYDLYMPGTMKGWVHDDKTLMTWDAERGVYHLDNIKLGDSSHRFKITGFGWKHQFGLGVNGEATPEEASTLTFDGDSVVRVLDEYEDSKDIFLDLGEAGSLAGDPVYLDATVRVLDESRDQVELTLRKDLPPIENAKSLTLKLGDTSIPLEYANDGNYQGTVQLQADSENPVTVSTPDDSIYYQFGELSDGQTQAVSDCSSECGSALKVTDGFYYELTLNVAEDGSKTASLRKLSVDEVKVSVPHFDADGEPVTKVFSPYPYEFIPEDQTVMVSAKDKSAPLRTFTLSSDADLRDSGPGYRVVTEYADQPRAHTGNLLFDALFAQAVDDMKLNSASQISDGSYNGGAAIDCDCFQTGEQWTYVWTRDLAYSANLALAHMDPARVVNSMLFKISGFRGGLAIPSTLPQGTTQIIQDTGSGGSWPVSTDRVTWALAARSVLNTLTGDALTEFKDKAYAALKGTVEADRQAAFDSEQGLYGGEQSYLDWRTQTYAPWITNNLSRMANSKALSTNVAHYEALRLTAELAAEKGDAEAQKYQDWAETLKQAINDRFWLEDVGLYASLTTAAEDQAPLHKYDMLGTALAVLSGVAPADRAALAMSHYPHGRLGVPVYYPQQPDIAPYHNRALWPFVTAYAARAGAEVDNAPVVDNAINSLVRGAALNLSNMENLEWLSGKPSYAGGPIINSRRQLWSVAGYLDMVMGTIFGYHVTDGGIEIKPFLTDDARTLLGDGDTVALEHINYKGKQLTIELKLPVAGDGAGYYPISNINFDGAAISGNLITDDLIAGSAAPVITVEFGNLVPAGGGEITMIDDENLAPWDHDQRVYSPRVASVTEIRLVDGAFTVDVSDTVNDPASVSYNIYRDGELVAQALAQTGAGALSWSDSGLAPVDGKRYCYAVEAKYLSSGNISHHSEPVCYETGAVQVIGVDSADVSSNLTAAIDSSITPPQPVLADWGEQGDSLVANDIQIATAGKYAIEVVYNNAHGDISTGVTNAVKTLIVKDEGGNEVDRGVVQMPIVEQRDGSNPLRSSTEMVVELQPGSYSLEVEDYFNMSYLQSNASYGGQGGQGGALNKASVAEFRVVALPE